MSGDLYFLFHALPVFFIKYCHKLCTVHTDSYFLFHALPAFLLSTVISFVYKDKWCFDESMSVILCMESNEKEFFYSLSTLTLC